jgi:hypothetical protein
LIAQESRSGNFAPYSVAWNLEGEQRLSITARNLTDHTNPLQIHNNVADPQYGEFFGNYGRHYLADFDFLF